MRVRLLRDQVRCRKIVVLLVEVIFALVFVAACEAQPWRYPGGAAQSGRIDCGRVLAEVVCQRLKTDSARTVVVGAPGVDQLITRLPIDHRRDDVAEDYGRILEA